MSVVTLGDVKTHLNISVTTYDVELQGFIDAAESALGRLCGPLAPVSVTEFVSAAGQVVTLSSLPVISLTSMTPTGSATPLDISGLVLNGLAGVVSGVDTGTYTVVYMAGLASLPADLKLAVKEFVRHLWTTQRGPTRRPGSTDSDAASNTLPGAGYLLPFRVQELIRPYVAPGFA